MEDDLYGDLYADDSAQQKSSSSNAYGSSSTQDTSKPSTTAPAADTKPTPAATAPTAGQASTSVKQETPAATSFIPGLGAASGASKPASSGSSFIPPALGSSGHNADSYNSGAAASAAQSYDSGQQSSYQQANTGNSAAGYSNASGGGAGAAPSGGSQHSSLLKDDGKMFVGGLNWDTTDDGLKKYFSQFGKVRECTIMRDPTSGKSRGFAFLTFEEPKSVNTVMVREHFLDGKIIDPKRAIPRPEQARTQKCFVGGLPQSTTQESFRNFFGQFGVVLNSTVMMDRDTGKPRGFGFVTFEDDSSVEHCIRNSPLVFDGLQVDIRRATSKNDPHEKPSDRNAGGGGDRGYGGSAWAAGSPQGSSSGGYNAGQVGASAMNPMMMGGMGGMGGMMNPMMMGMMGMGGQSGGAPAFDPQAMAKMYQNMGWGSKQWNPQMAWQQMMQNMSAMYGQGAGAGAAGAAAGGSAAGQAGWTAQQGALNQGGEDGGDDRGRSPDYNRGGNRERESSPGRRAGGNAGGYGGGYGGGAYGGAGGYGGGRANRY